MTDLDYLGDEGYEYTSYPLGPHSYDTKEYISAPISSQLDLEINPHKAGQFDGLNPEEIELVQCAYNVFHVPFARKANELQRMSTSPRDMMYNPVNAYVDDRLPDLGHAFRLFRQVMGEEAYGGMTLELTTEEETPLDEFLQLASEGKLSVSSSNYHDAMVHVMGGLLAIGELTDLVKAGAHDFLGKPRMEKKQMGGLIDLMTARVRAIWLTPEDSRGEMVAGLVETIMDLQAVRGVEFSAAEAIEIAVKQARQIKSWQKERLFLTPGVAKNAAKYLVEQQQKAA